MINRFLNWAGKAYNWRLQNPATGARITSGEVTDAIENLFNTVLRAEQVG